ncbi:MAG: type II secretion system protein [Succinivibrionaceae bacterium]
MKNSTCCRNKGFSLIELVLVIVILGILAATAAPKFMDLKRDATIAKMQGLAAALKSGINMVHMNAIIHRTGLIGNNDQGAECTEASHVNKPCVLLNGVWVRVKWGYPDQVESYKIITADIKNYDGYNTKLRCNKISDQLSKTPCEAEYCRCSVPSDYQKIDNNQFGISIFWPQGYTYSGGVKDTDCFVAYVQPNDQNNPTTKVILHDKGC